MSVGVFISAFFCFDEMLEICSHKFLVKFYFFT